MDESQFWVSIWKIAGATLFGICACAAGCEGFRIDAVSKAIENGTAPLAARCAVYGEESYKAICAKLAVKGPAQ